jgi:hypothetical protein
MADREPVVELGPFSGVGAAPTSWRQASCELEDAQVYWLSTCVRTTSCDPLLGAWLRGALYFCTGPAERKAKNLSGNPVCAVTTGRNSLDGLDLVVEYRPPARDRSYESASMTWVGLRSVAADPSLVAAGELPFFSSCPPRKASSARRIGSSA